MRLQLLLASYALKTSYDSSSSALVLAETMKSVRIGISLAGLPLFLEVRDPMVITNRGPLVRELIEAHQALIEPLPRPCDETRVASTATNKNASSAGSRDNLAALVDCWEPVVLQQVESHLIKQELLSQCSGEYWPLQEFYRGEYYSNEVNRLVLNVVTTFPDQFFEPAVNLLRGSVAQNPANGYPFAAAASTLAQILDESGSSPYHRDEASRVLQDSVLAVPGHSLRHAHLSPSNSSMYRLPLATSSSSSLQGHHHQHPSFHTVSWSEAVDAAKVTIVCVATRRTLKLRALERSAVALGHSVTILGLGQKWPGFGLKVKLFAEYLESLSAEYENNLILFVDAYDVLLLEPFRHLKRRYLAQQSAVLFSAEIAPSPDSSTSLLYDEVDGTNRRGSLPYLNSGSILGLAKDLRVVLRDVVADLLHNHAAALTPKAGSDTNVGNDSSNEKTSQLLSDLPMDIEDQRWFTRYYLRRKLTVAHDVRRSHGDGSGGDDRQKSFETEKHDGGKEAAVDGNWRTFVALDRLGDLFQTTHETTPAQYRLGAVGALFANYSGSGFSGRTSHSMHEARRCSHIEEAYDFDESDENEKSQVIAQQIEEGYASQPTGAFGGAGLVWNTATQRAPLLLHGNDWKERTFNALGKGLQAGGWPPAPFWLETSLPSLPGDPPGDPTVDDPTGDDTPTSDSHPTASTLLGGSKPSHGLWVRWTDSFFDLLHAYQDRHRSWLPHEDCGPHDHECMSDRLRIFLGQRMVKHELQHMEGDVMPLLPLLRGAPGLHSHFWTDLMMRGVLDHDSSFSPNATKLLRVAVESRPQFAPASHLLAEVLVRFGADGNGATRLDQSEARKVLLKSVLVFDSFSETERAAATGAERRVLAQCATLGCETWPLIYSSFYQNTPLSSLSSEEDAADIAVRVVTVASESRPELTAMMQAARQLGLGSVTVLGLGLPWPGLGQKVVLLHDWLKRSLRDGSVKASDLVLFLDAFDVLLLPPCTRDNLFRRFQAARVPVLFGAEAASSPDLAAALIDSGLPSPSSPFNSPTTSPMFLHSPPLTDATRPQAPSYLNSGTILGPAGTLMCVLEEVYADLVLSGHSEPADSNDQRWFTRYRLRHGPFCAPIDTNSTLFLTLHGLTPNDLVVHPGGAVTLTQKEASDHDGPLLVHGNGEDTLFRSIVNQVHNAGWPRRLEDDDGAEEQNNIPATVAAATNAANDNVKVFQTGTTAATSMQATIEALNFDKAFDYESICPPLIAASSAAANAADTTATTESVHPSSDSLWESVTTAVEVNGQRESFSVAFHEDPMEVATIFVRKHGVLIGAGCDFDGGSNNDNLSDKAVRCTADLLAFQVDRLRFIREVEVMAGRTFDLLGFFWGRGYSRFLNNMLLRGVLRDRPDLRLNATRVLRCALLNATHSANSPSYYDNNDDGSSSSSGHFVATAYSLVDVLHQVSLAETNEDALSDALAILNTSIEVRVPNTGSILSGLSASRKPTNVKYESNYSDFQIPPGVSPENRLHVVTVATEHRPELKALTLSIELSLNTVNTTELPACCESDDRFLNEDNCSCDNNVNAVEGSNTFKVLGLNEAWGGLGSKVVWLRKHLATLPPHDLVVFTDAYDVLATSAAAHTAEIFHSFRAAIVFGCEVEASPDAAVAQFLLAKPSQLGSEMSTPASLRSLLDPQQESFEGLPPLPHLNSGLFMGSAGAVLAMLSEVSSDVEAHHSAFDGNGDVDDQRFFWRFYLRHRHSLVSAQKSGNDGKDGVAVVALDTSGVLFHSFHGVNPDALLVSDAAKGELFSAFTKTTPAFVHGNAGGRTALAAATRALQEPASWLSGFL